MDDEPLRLTIDGVEVVADRPCDMARDYRTARFGNVKAFARMNRRDLMICNQEDRPVTVELPPSSHMPGKIRIEAGGEFLLSGHNAAEPLWGDPPPSTPPCYVRHIAGADIIIGQALMVDLATGKLVPWPGPWSGPDHPAGIAMRDIRAGEEVVSDAAMMPGRVGIEAKGDWLAIPIEATPDTPVTLPGGNVVPFRDAEAAYDPAEAVDDPPAGSWRDREPLL